MVPPALIGLLAGLFIRNVPSLKRTMSQPVLGVRQYRPRLAFIAGYVLLVGGLVAAPIYVTIKYGDPMASFYSCVCYLWSFDDSVCESLSCVLYPANRNRSLLEELAVEDSVYAV